MMQPLPRRTQVGLLEPAEQLIRLAMVEVEKMGADPALTDAVVHLGEAGNCVADFIDGKKAEVSATDEVIAVARHLLQLAQDRRSTLNPELLDRCEELDAAVTILEGTRS